MSHPYRFDDCSRGPSPRPPSSSAPARFSPPCRNVKRTTHRTKRRLALAWTALVSLLGVSCGGDHDDARDLPVHRLEVSGTLGSLWGRILSDRDFVVVPNRAWEVKKDTEQWLFVGTAGMICHIERRPEQAIVFGFLPDEETIDKPLRFFWNSQDVTHLLRRAGERELQVEIPPSWLDPGTYFLTVGLEGLPEERAVFDAIGYRYGGPATVLGSDRFLKWRYLADLLSSGVTGSYDREKMGGFLFDGPRELILTLGDDGGEPPTAFVTRLQNSSYGPARFLATAGDESIDVTLEVHERTSLRLPIPDGVAELRLRVEGDPNGLFLWGAPALVRKNDRRPPIILVTLDTTRRDVLGAYGGDREITPHLSAFADAATVYDRAWATSPWTLPSHASIFTGLYPSRHGAGVRSDHLVAAQETLAERLGNEGYLTVGFAGGTLCSYRFGLAQGFGVYRDPDGFETRGDLLTDEVAEFLRDYRSHFHGQPLLLFINYFDPHFPYQTSLDILPRRVRQRLRSGAHEPQRLPATWSAILDGDGDAWRRLISGEVEADPAAFDLLHQRYLAEVAFVDQQIGRLLDLLRESGLYEEALIAIAADHGELLGEGGFFSHTSRLDPELLAIPFFLKWPQQTGPRRVQAPVALVDLFATLLRAGRGGEATGDGLLLTPRDDEGRAPLDGRDAVFGEEHETSAHTLFANMRLGEHAWARIDRRRLQLVWQGPEDGRRCLDVSTTRWGRVACDPATIVSAAELRQRLGFVDEPSVAHGKVVLTAEESRALRALGYLD